MDETDSRSQRNIGMYKRQQLVDECRDESTLFLAAQLARLFDQLEPVFVELAQNAETDAIQNRLFDSLNLTLSQRERIENEFMNRIDEGFQAFLDGRPIPYPASPIEARNEVELGVVEDEVLDEYLAIQNLIYKAQNSFYRELYALGKRLAVLRGGKKLEDDDIPACPAHLAITFQESIKTLELENQIRYTLYSLFGRFVLDDTGAIYQSLNDRLIDADILPNLKLTGIVPPPSRYTRSLHSKFDKTAGKPGIPESQGAIAPTTKASPDEEALFKSIQDLLLQRRADNPEYDNHPDIGSGPRKGPMLNAPAIAQAIHSLQPTSQAKYLPDPESADGIPQKIELDTGLLQNIRHTLESEQEKLLRDLDKDTIPAADLDTIELVGMLFDQVLDEEGLSNIAKALISHLHTPYLKVAILDREFLKNEQHIARRLLNLMVESGKRWIEEEDLRRGIYYPLQAIVKTILAEFKTELSLFDEMFYRLQSQLNELDHRANVLEQRNKEAAKGRERLETARQRAKELIIERVGNRTLHPTIKRFLTHAWQDRLILMLLRNPNIEKDKEWNSALAVIDSLGRIMEARSNSKVKQWLTKNHVNLIKHITAGLHSLGNHHNPDSRALFELIKQIVHEPSTSQAETTEPLEAITVREPIVQQKQAGDPTSSATVSPAPLSDEAKKMLQQLRNIKFGTWFELQDDEGSERRLKLSWFSPITHKYMFVDRFGMQAYITPSEALAEQMCAGKARIIDTNELPFVSRALKTIHALLKRTIGIHTAH